MATESEVFPDPELPAMPMMLVFAQGGSYCTFSSITEYTVSRTTYGSISPVVEEDSFALIDCS